MRLASRSLATPVTSACDNWARSRTCTVGSGFLNCNFGRASNSLCL